MMETTQIQAPAKLTLADLATQIQALTERVAALEAPKPSKNGSPREMTEADARRILTGDLAETKHQAAADLLGLSYGQVYSCRLEFTFKAVHKEMAAAGKKNPWKK